MWLSWPNATNTCHIKWYSPPSVFRFTDAGLSRAGASFLLLVQGHLFTNQKERWRFHGCHDCIITERKSRGYISFRISVALGPAVPMAVRWIRMMLCCYYISVNEASLVLQDCHQLHGFLANLHNTGYKTLVLYSYRVENEHISPPDYKVKDFYQLLLDNRYFINDNQ